MQIEKNGSGPWPGVDVEGVTVTLTVGDDALSFDCADLQEDGQVTVDVVRGHDGGLAVGVEKGVEYVANLIIPPVRYEDVPLPVTLEEPDLPEDLDPACITPAPTTESVRVPLAASDMEAVRLILWTVTDNMEDNMATIITKDSLRSSVESATGGLCTVLYDDAGHPSFMRRIPKMRIEDLYPDLGLTGTHPAFIVNGVEKSELFIGMYPASLVDSYAVSLPGMDPANYLNFDTLR